MSSFVLSSISIEERGSASVATATGTATDTAAAVVSSFSTFSSCASSWSSALHSMPVTTFACCSTSCRRSSSASEGMTWQFSSL
eukprot:CAMPEP_0171364238 /NCGR_PEP_ID=MMETSP0879-20121228/3914_1 /TAXON_ID=67004 /ORGANISM="Thalassiosira weissflogii, Strain CCMP1336" /LENGTH=83 /DNA_ID=CAMNT_0011871581 /DNA_START=88 /DNA_END=335 /DNA_ORIENTATION=-